MKARDWILLRATARQAGADAWAALRTFDFWIDWLEPLCWALTAAVTIWGAAMGFGLESGRREAPLLAAHWVPKSQETLARVARGEAKADTKLWGESVALFEREGMGEADAGAARLARACEEAGHCQRIGGAGLSVKALGELAGRGELPGDASVSEADRQAAVEAIKASAGVEGGRRWLGAGAGAALGLLACLALAAVAGAVLKASEWVNGARLHWVIWKRDRVGQIAERARAMEAKALSRAVGKAAGEAPSPAGSKARRL